MNSLVLQHDYKKLVDAYGEHNVESAINFILNSQDLHGFRLLSDHSPKVVGEILRAVHGRDAAYSGCYLLYPPK